MSFCSLQIMFNLCIEASAVNPTEMDRMLVDHIADMEDGAKRLDRLSQEISKAMDQLLAKWAASNGWLVSGT